MQTNEGQITSTSSSDRNDPDTTSVTASHMSQALLTPTLLSHGQVGRTCTLPTALVHIRNSQGTYTSCRVLLDTGSELSYVSERCIKALGLNRAPGRILISGISSIKADTTRGFSTLTIKHGIQLGIAYRRSTRHRAILTGNRKLDAQGNIIAISTIFGWVITSIAYQNPSITTSFLSTVDIHATLQRFWKIEDSQITTHHDTEYVKVEEHFQTTHSRDSKGRYTVELPFKDADPQFTDTLQGATQRFTSVERRLHRDTDLHSRVIGKNVLTFEKMHTLLAQIEAVVNSRPLFSTSDTEVNYLSPAHFLIGRPYTTVPEGDLSTVPINRLDYRQQTQAMLQGFWKQWHMEYLTSLQHRPKWMNKSVNMAKDDIVLLKDSHTPPAAWPLGRVIETYPGKDGMVRAVRLRTPTGETTHPIVKLALLPNSETVFQGRPGC
ncbi:uncharacterized protein LOC123258213 [Drosophila ananassae]|uniref:uncharacterized protein LOC123258213 n=1 Tax=Drosophila ananassae TaxID=7217 RepID=UPI001CFF67EC|nr:uncharacterized protein LOC123258213 [Drosophila ananassae]